MSNITTPADEAATIRFNEKYITAAEITKDLNISRSNLLYARKTGKLPGAININDGYLFFWEREAVQPYLSAWKIMLTTRRGV
jgi:hypothetical protein